VIDYKDCDDLFELDKWRRENPNHKIINIETRIRTMANSAQYRVWFYK
jgi:hypothetical protein